MTDNIYQYFHVLTSDKSLLHFPVNHGLKCDTACDSKTMTKCKMCSCVHVWWWWVKLQYIIKATWCCPKISVSTHLHSLNKTYSVQIFAIVSNRYDVNKIVEKCLLWILYIMQAYESLNNFKQTNNLALAWIAYLIIIIYMTLG